jgi:hypothetical protein
VNIFVVSPRAGLAGELKSRLQSLTSFENAIGLDPGHDAKDLEPLRKGIKP